MRAVVQRVSSASVRVDGKRVSEMGEGLLALVGVGVGDDDADAKELAHRLVNLRIFSDADGRMNRSLIDVAGTLCVVSQFTLYGDARQGRRPFFGDAAPAAEAAERLEYLTAEVRRMGVPVAQGRFGASMDVSLVNTGPVTILLDTEKKF